MGIHHVDFLILLPMEYDCREDSCLLAGAQESRVALLIGVRPAPF
jgi:hypothetical protein